MEATKQEAPLKDLPTKDYFQACFEKCTENLTPLEKAEVEVWWGGKVPQAFYETISRNAHSAILELCSLGCG